jgi:phage terminase small subunit
VPILPNARHERFAQELAKGKSATEAYVLAGYKANDGNAGRLNRNEQVQARVAELTGRGAEQAQITVARVLQELGRLGFSDLRRAFDENGNLKPPSQWDDEFAASIASIEVVTKTLPGRDDESARVEYVHKIKVWDKNSALDKIAKHLGMLVERHEHTGKDGEQLVVSDRDLAKAVAEILADGIDATRH